MGLEELFEELQMKLYKPFIFYIPSSVIPEEKNLEFQDAKYAVYFNNVVLIDSKGFDRELKAEPSYYEMMTKKASLDKTLFKFLEKKEALEVNQFEFLLEKYLEHLNFCVYVSEWLFTNLVNHITCYSEETKNTFKLQSNTFANHFSDVKSKLLITDRFKNKPIDVLNFVQNKVPVVNNTLKTIIPEDQELKPEKEIKKRPKKQMPLLVDEQVEDFLLRTVFNAS
ncbi:hypothetical protein NO995_14720 [Aestuariibaculum sp. M13]|uniref:hypothetical protein n=1 Tax=Aestuariibaculum sp. M13 TaxID=2967132 RepID=UPI002159F0D2|nr:hypothetical protein [Aestuariibaculum sp. M13]MCR8668937.1 hypothetical protein [Aestuariibaculum sp. M13]